MSEKPKNQTEQRLEEYARRRQGELGVPLDMHDATRTMLHGEVRRQYGTAYDRATTETAEPAGTPWLGWAFGAAAVGAVAFLVSLNPGQPSGPEPSDMAKAQPGNTQNQVAAQENSRDTLNKASKNSGRFKAAPSLPANARMAPGGVASANSLNSGGGSPGFSAPGTPGETKVRNTPLRVVGRPDVVRLPNAYYNNLRELRQEFAQAKNALPKPVLVQFQVERNGNQVRVIDGDGSVYTGSVINEEEFADAKEAAAKRDKTVDKTETQTAGVAAAPPATTPSPAAPATPAVVQVRAIPISAPRGQFYFRASGTNKTLRKRVIIEATFDHPVDRKAKKIASNLRTNGGTARPKPTVPAQPVAKKPNIQAVRAIARMRVLGNARIENSNYRVDAYQQAGRSGPQAKPKPAPLKKAGKQEKK